MLLFYSIYPSTGISLIYIVLLLSYIFLRPLFLMWRHACLACFCFFRPSLSFLLTIHSSDTFNTLQAYTRNNDHHHPPASSSLQVSYVRTYLLTYLGQSQQPYPSRATSFLYKHPPYGNNTALGRSCARLFAFLSNSRFAASFIVILLISFNLCL